VFLFAPINHPNMHLDNCEKDKLKKSSRISVMLLALLAISMSFVPDIRLLSVVVGAAMLNVAALIVLSKITKQEATFHEENKTKREEDICRESMHKTG
jgi:hypothetical protein